MENGILLGLSARRIGFLPTGSRELKRDWSCPDHTGWVRTIAPYGGSSGLVFSAACNYIKAWNLSASEGPRHLCDTRVFVGDILDLGLSPWRLERDSRALPSLYAASNDGVVFGFHVHVQNQGTSRPILQEIIQRKVCDARVVSVVAVRTALGRPRVVAADSAGSVALLDPSTLAVLDRRQHGPKVHSLRPVRGWRELEDGDDTRSRDRNGGFVTASEDGTAALWTIDCDDHLVVEARVVHASDVRGEKAVRMAEAYEVKQSQPVPSPGSVPGVGVAISNSAGRGPESESELDSEIRLHTGGKSLMLQVHYLSYPL